MRTIFLATATQMTIERPGFHLTITGDMSTGPMLELARQYLDPRDFETVKAIHESFGGLDGIRIERDDEEEDLQNLRFD